MDSNYDRNERERKQTYLKNEIVLKGYGKDEFAAYMNDVKENGGDIDIWTFDELSKVVERFQRDSTGERDFDQNEESSEEEDVYRYLHPSEIEKIKERNKKAKEIQKSKTLVPKSIPADSHPLEEEKQNVPVSKQASDDQSGWEKDDIEIEFLKENLIEEESQEELKKKTSDKKAEKPGLPRKMNTEINKEKIKNFKVKEKDDEEVEKALDDFFGDEDREYDIIKGEAQGSLTENEEIKTKVIENMTPKGDYDKKQKKKAVKEKEVEYEDPSLIQSFIADVKTSSETKLTYEPNVKVKVYNATYGPGSIFQFAYNEYTIVTNPFGWVIKRREQDFAKLREYLVKVFPQYLIPPLVTPRAMYDSDSLKEKEIYFSKFLNDVVSNEELRAGKYIELFLSIEDEKAYKPIRKKYEKTAVKPNELSDFSTIDGKVSINASPHNSELCKNYQTRFVNKYQMIFKKLEEATDEIEKNSIALSQSMEKFSKYFEELSDLYSDIGFEEYTDLYGSIKDLTLLYGDGIREQSKCIKKNLQYEFKYHFFESESFKELGKLKTDVEYVYKKWKKDLKFQKDKLWSYRELGDFSKWNLHQHDLDHIEDLIIDEKDAKSKMLPRETEFLMNKKNLLNYIENQGVKEIRRSSKLQWKSFKNEFIKIATDQSKILNKMHVYWADFSMKYSM